MRIRVRESMCERKEGSEYERVRNRRVGGSTIKMREDYEKKESKKM